METIIGLAVFAAACFLAAFWLMKEPESPVGASLAGDAPVGPVSDREEDLRDRVEVKFARKWMKARLVQVCSFGLGQVELTDPRTHSRVITRGWDEIRIP